MLRDCKKCSYYKRLAQFNHITIHHYCSFFKSSYVFLKMQGKLKECPLRKIEVKKEEYQLTNVNQLLEALSASK
ncbi:MAG: hypothetical protein ACTSRS_19945 [Candidatus Helarchaeota archaeon]